jgi:RNA polymerase sigma-70 factor (ECF subfamily)
MQTELEDIIKGCKEQDERSQDSLYSRFSPLFYAICLRYLKDRDDAQDVLHDSFIKVFDKISSFSGEGSFEGWMKRILVNNCLNFLKDKKKVLKIENELWVEREYPVFEVTVDESMDIDPTLLMAMIQKLPVGYRTVFNLFVIDGFDHKAISEKLNISEGTSRSQLLKARRYLKDKLTDYLKDERKKYKY